jgi:uncharacterized phage protein gp47/JayE
MYNPPSIGSAGLTLPIYTDILADNIAQFKKIFGANQYVGTDSAIYQLIAIFSLKMSDCCEALQYVYNQSSPFTAVGAGLDRIVKLNGIARIPYTYSVATVTLIGTQGTVITNGICQDTNGYQWLLRSPVTIPSGSSIDVTATCATPGAITAEAGAISIIATPIGGWASVTNANPVGVGTGIGTPIEPDSKLRARQAISVALPSQTMLAGTIADLFSIPGVTRVAPGLPTSGGPGSSIENPTGASDSWGNPPHSITMVVEGGTDQEIAQAIYNNRGIGCFTNGTTTVTITDPTNGDLTMDISFDRPTYVPISVTLSVHLLAGGTSATLAAIQQAIVDYLNSLEIGESVIFSELYGAALTARSNPDQPTFSIKTLYSGLGAMPSGTDDIALAFNEVASGLIPNVVVNSV